MAILGNTPCELLGRCYQERKPGCCTKVGGINPLGGVENSLEKARVANVVCGSLHIRGTISSEASEEHGDRVDVHSRSSRSAFWHFAHQQLYNKVCETCHFRFCKHKLHLKMQ